MHNTSYPKHLKKMYEAFQTNSLAYSLTLIACMGLSQVLAFLIFKEMFYIVNNFHFTVISLAVFFRM